jgi:hypothetical protein
MSSVYVTGELADQLIRAEEIIYGHLTQCALCAAARPCYERDHAEDLFARYGLLPRRVPGLTRKTLPRDWDV